MSPVFYGSAVVIFEIIIVRTRIPISDMGELDGAELESCFLLSVLASLFSMVVGRPPVGHRKLS